MMNPPYFTFTPLHRHVDEGFGAIGDAFKAAGDELSNSKGTDMHATYQSLTFIVMLSNSI